MILVLLGAPGVGKGTQAKNICKEYNIPHISTGEIFRQHIKDQTEIGKLAQKYIMHGNLVPDEVTQKILIDRIEQEDCKAGYVLDGFPRTIVQAEKLDEYYKKHGIHLSAAIDIEVPDDVLIKRLTGRWTCPNCNANFNENSLPSKVEGICDFCGHKLVKRDDDSEKTVRNRLDVYEENTLPLIKYYESAGKLLIVDGLQPIDEIQKEILKKADELND